MKEGKGQSKSKIPLGRDDKGGDQKYFREERRKQGKLSTTPTGVKR